MSEASADRRRGRANALADSAKRREVQASFLASLVVDEHVLARNGSTFVSDRRVVEAVWLEHRWLERSVSFTDVSGWRRGAEHDARPFVSLTHAPVARQEWVPGHRFLWFRWGRGIRTVPSTRTEFSFGRQRDRVYAALVDALTVRAIPEGQPIERRPEGNRAERIGSSRTLLAPRVD
jgi:hypothetical protein